MRKIHALLLGTAMSLSSHVAHAQQQATPAPADTAADPTGEVSAGDIVVTAQKTSEKLSKAPVAISVVSQDTILRQGVDSAVDLATTAPGLQLSTNGFALRGIGSTNAFSGYSTVATQIDGVYDPSAAVLTLGLFDIGSVEVLRGPQGTVYGRNATAGVVNINTADPGNTLGYLADLQYGRFNEIKAQAAIDLPIGDHLAIRASAYRQVDDGIYGRYAATQNFGKTDQSGLRLNGILRIGGRLTWRLSLNYGRNQGTVPVNFVDSIITYPQANIAAGIFGPRQVTDTPGRLNPGQDQVTDNRIDLTYYAARSRLTWDVTDALSLTYVAGYSLLKDNGIAAATGVFSSQSIDRRVRTMSHELDANYAAGPLNLVLGAFAYQDKQPSGTRLLHAGDAVPAPFNSVVNALGAAKIVGTGITPSTQTGVDVVTSYFGQGTKSQAVFGQGTLEVLPGLKLIGGVRGTWEQVNARNIELVCLGDTVTLANISATSCPGVPFVLALSDDRNRPEARFSNVSWKAGADYEITPDTLLYGTVSTGFRGGGLDASSNAPQFRQYRPETVTNYEAGVRSTLAEGRVYIALTAFNMDYKDLQVSSIVPNPLINQVSAVTTNAATARLRGVELETTLRPIRHDRLSGYVSFLDAKIRSFPAASDNLNSAGGGYNALTTILGNRPLPANLVRNASGSELPRAPRWSARASYTHVVDLGSAGKLSPSVDFYVQSRTFGTVINYPESRIPSYTKTDLNLRYDDPTGKFSLTGFVNNLEDNRINVALTPVWSSVTALYAPPRTYGVRLGLQF